MRFYLLVRIPHWAILPWKTKIPMALKLVPLIIVFQMMIWTIFMSNHFWSHAFLWGNLLESHLMEEIYSKRVTKGFMFI